MKEALRSPFVEEKEVDGETLECPFMPADERTPLRPKPKKLVGPAEEDVMTPPAWLVTGG